jgi:hypothetical protein
MENQMSKVFHRDVGVFDPTWVDWDGDRFVDDDGHEVPSALVKMFDYSATGHTESTTRFEVWKDKGAEESVCAVCGGHTFYVGSRDWDTYTKCTNCGTERCVHSG